MNFKLPSETETRLTLADKFWSDFRLNNQPIKNVVYSSQEIVSNHDFDVVICGSTLGIFLATTLQQKGYKVAIIEKNILLGREQEWNISRSELESLLELDLLTSQELEKIIFTEYNPARIGFYKGYELWVKNILNVGVSPKLLIAKIKEKFISLDGVILENTAFNSAQINDNGVEIKTDKNSLKTRLLIDSMGHFSPIVKQIRNGEKPDGVCLVVGSCGKGFKQNETGDLIYSFTPIINQCQYFWEAFPAKDGRTTYLFTYVDANPERISLKNLMTEYLRLLPEYQQIELDNLDFQRFLFGFFPAYRQSPLKMPWDRIIAVGDSSGMQSPVSFGGFGAMMRHLPRLSLAIDEALKGDYLTREDLALIQPYQPNISVTWLFQKTMSVPIDKQPQPNQINDLMSGVFRVMDKLGDDVLKPFLQDVVQFSGLTKTLPLVNPMLVLPLLPQVGLPILADWLKHYLSLGVYTGLYSFAKGFIGFSEKFSPRQQYYYHRYLELLQYGSGDR
ncbi:FAD-binding oxidoreductase [Cyanobacterium aponinum AL20118]|uniref:FAD-binding oxidoreductase n=1 Tax=Cyanobacterium aponinum AL20115 TaxID=3090662 RepID=A0AAF0ZCT3_9CHRO|nr:FAD-binding oxidoreductase [Cyanobacterium aponinum]WPF87905.1 FAD-binding oxidoreductase [Cyanobacterium aponinum AL20115]